MSCVERERERDETHDRVFVCMPLLFYGVGQACKSTEWGYDRSRLDGYIAVCEWKFSSYHGQDSSQNGVSE